MKHTKKIIMVPEAEWLTMLNMIKGSEPLAYEKVDTEMKMAKILRDPKLSEDIKAKKYNWLYKRRRQLKKEIAEEASKPQRIVIDPEQLNAIRSDMSKYLGVAPAPVRTILKGVSAKRQRRIGRKKNVDYINDNEFLDDEFLDASDEYRDANEPKPIPVQQPEQQLEQHAQPSTSKQYILHPNYRDDFIDIIKKGHSAKLQIAPKSKTVGGIQGSNYEDIADYLANTNLKKPPGTDFVIDTLKKEPFYKQALQWADYHRQKGEGKRRKTTKKKTYKPTKFKPVIWEKII